MAKVPTDEVLQQRRDILRSRGVPEAFIEDIATRRDYLISPTIKALVLCFIGIGMGAWICISLIHGFALWMHIYANQTGLTANTRLFSYSNIQEFSFIALMIGIMSMPSWVWAYLNRRVMPHPFPNETATQLREPASEQLENWLIKFVKNETKTAENESAFLAGSTEKSLIILNGLVVVPFVVAGIVFALGHGHYWALYPDRLVSHDFGQSKVYKLEDATSVTVGCNHTDDGEWLNYQLYFGNKKFNLDDGDFDLSEVEFLKRLEQTNEQLRQNRKIRFERWRWPNRDPMAPDCVTHWEEVAGKEGKTRIQRLLAVP